jgi:hypothetical protein
VFHVDPDAVEATHGRDLDDARLRKIDADAGGHATVSQLRDDAASAPSLMI